MKNTNLKAENSLALSRIPKTEVLFFFFIYIEKLLENS